MIGHLIIIKEPEHLPVSDSYPRLMKKLTLDEPAVTDTG